MKLSEAILLGRSLVTPRRADFGSCAWGMAAAANGKNGSQVFKEACASGWEDVGIAFGYPWTSKIAGQAPCEHAYLEYSPIAYIIAHLFDEHVFGTADWTVERIAEWIATIEPKELPAPKDDKEESRQFNGRMIEELCEIGEKIIDAYADDLRKRFGMSATQYKQAEELYLYGDLSGK